MTNGKMTERDLMNGILDGTVDNDALVEYAQKRIAQLDKRNASAQKRAEKKRAEGDALTEAVFGVLNAEPQNREAILEALTEQGFEGLTPAKVTARLTRLVKENRAEKQKGKTEGADGKMRETTLYVAA